MSYIHIAKRKKNGTPARESRSPGTVDCSTAEETSFASRKLPEGTGRNSTPQRNQTALSLAATSKPNRAPRYPRPGIGNPNFQSLGRSVSALFYTLVTLRKDSCVLSRNCLVYRVSLPAAFLSGGYSDGPILRATLLRLGSGPARRALMSFVRCCHLATLLLASTLGLSLSAQAPQPRLRSPSQFTTRSESSMPSMSERALYQSAVS